MTATISADQKPCLHPHARHQHGTRAAYTLDGCRCPACRRARAQYDRELHYRHVNAVEILVAPDAARDHVARLRAAGMGTRSIAAAAGVSRSAIKEIADGTSTTIQKDTADRIVAVAVPSVEHLAPAQNVDSTGTRRRVQALMTNGWPLSRIAAHAGRDRQALERALRGGDVLAATAVAVRATFDELWDQRPDTSTPALAAGVTRARQTAAAAGWHPPAAWDDDAIDDPTRGPAITTTPGARGVLDLDEWAYLVTTGEEPHRAAARCGVSWNAVEMAIARTGHERAVRALREWRAAA